MVVDVAVIVWLVLLIVFVVIEALTVGLASVWFAVGALVAAIAAGLHVGVVWQVVLFFVVSIVLLIATRPFARRFNRRTHATNMDALIGQTVLLKERTGSLGQDGSADLQGKTWTVRTEGGVVMEAGERAVVTGVEGVHLIVAPEVSRKE